MGKFTAPTITDPTKQRLVKVPGIGTGRIDFKTEAEALAFDEANKPPKGKGKATKRTEPCPLGGEDGSILHMSRPITATKPKHTCGVSNERAVAVKRGHVPTSNYTGQRRHRQNKVLDPFRGTL
jgi:hypothetical protein